MLYLRIVGMYPSYLCLWGSLDLELTDLTKIQNKGMYIVTTETKQYIQN